MGNYTVSELLEWMDDKSKTEGWDAIVSYDKDKTNDLLHQLFIERFNSRKGYIPPITTSMPTSGYLFSELYGLRLSYPKLSFGSSSIDFTNAEADLTMDMFGGTIVSRLKVPGVPERVDRIQEVLPLGGPQLTMTLPLENTAGQVSDERLVTLDISKGKEFRANFVIGELDQTDIGNRFKIMFENLDADQKVFPIGRLGKELNEALTPESFELRTLKAPLFAGREEINPGDGCVMMFITLTGGKPGRIPSKPNPNDPNAFRYLIPKDEGGDKFKGSMLLSSRVLFDNVIRPYAIQSIGHDVDFVPYNNASDLAWSLTAYAGSIPVPGFEYNFNIFHTSKHMVKNIETMKIDFRLGTGDTPLTLKREDEGLALLWRTTTHQLRFRGHVWYPENPDIPDQPHKTDAWVRLTTDYKLKYKPVLNKEDGVVSFQRSNSPVLILEAKDHGALLNLYDKERYEAFDAHLYRSYFPYLNDLLAEVPVPNIDTFLIRNLLFGNFEDPNLNQSLHLSRAYIPGDLLLIGDIDPYRTSFRIMSDQSLVEIGKTLQFNILGKDMPTVNWSVEDPDGIEVDVGSISPQGLYQAPTQLKTNHLSVLVRAEGTLDSKPVQALAMISVMRSTIVVNPVYQRTAALKGDEEEPEEHYLRLTASTIDGSAPQWKLLQPENGAELRPDPNDVNNAGIRMYVQGPRDSKRPFILDTVEVKAPGGAPKVIKILVQNKHSLSLEAKTIDLESGQVHLRVRYDGEVINPEEYTLALLESGGEGGGLDTQTGIYTAPASSHNDFAIITVQTGSGSLDHYGSIVLPLPLSIYMKAPPVFDENNPSAVWQVN